MSEYLAAIPDEHLRKIIPNCWEEALHAVWKQETKGFRSKRRRNRAPANNATLTLRARILRVATREMRSDRIAADVGFNPSSVKYHLEALHREGQMTKRVVQHRAYYRAVSS